eukprot:CAMPEP_0172826618 /NCGR_PEP_ID=MMETSP1075-20121228/19538_1 /TAXON_ID=2916 /ORGANISM="Ceratium fusus, Strain PA161109" /LENGTH=66 /DNA_ID=CAMNT_0013668295 /DNA_START=22 /DNA_END=222 /DNA_ORIENTATION=-
MARNTEERAAKIKLCAAKRESPTMIVTSAMSLDKQYLCRSRLRSSNTTVLFKSMYSTPPMKLTLLL